MSRLVTKPSFRYFAHWKSDVRQRWQFFTILKTNAATIFFLATLPVVLRTVLGSAISANCASKTERHAVSSEGWLGCHVGHWSFGGSCLAKSLSMPSTFCQWLVFQLSWKAWGQLRRESGKTLFAGVTPDSIWCPDVCQQSSKLVHHHCTKLFCLGEKLCPTSRTTESHPMLLLAVGFSAKQPQIAEWVISLIGQHLDHYRSCKNQSSSTGMQKQEKKRRI